MLSQVSSWEENGGMKKIDLFEKFIEATFLCTTELLGHKDRLDEQEDGLEVFTMPKLTVKTRKSHFH